MRSQFRWAAPVAAILAVWLPWQIEEQRSRASLRGSGPVRLLSPADPPAATLPSPLRDPFITGQTWRANRRRDTRRSEARPPSGTVTGEPPVPAIAFGGSVLLDGQRLAVISGTLVPEGATLGKVRVLKVSMDNVVVEAYGRIFTLETGPGPKASVAPAIAPQAGPIAPDGPDPRGALAPDGRARPP
jgi:hypothetical protein